MVFPQTPKEVSWPRNSSIPCSWALISALRLARDSSQFKSGIPAGSALIGCVLYLRYNRQSSCRHRFSRVDVRRELSRPLNVYNRVLMDSLADWSVAVITHGRFDDERTPRLWHPNRLADGRVGHAHDDQKRRVLPGSGRSAGGSIPDHSGSDRGGISSGVGRVGQSRLRCRLHRAVG